MAITDKDGNALSSSEVIEKVFVRIKTIYLELVTGLLWWLVGYIPFHGFRRFFYRLSGMQIGAKSTIHMGARIYYPQGIEIGEGTLIGEKATLDGRKQLKNSHGGLKIGNHVDIASEVMIWTSQHDIHSDNMAAIEEKVEIGDYVSIGHNVTVHGAKVDNYALIGMGATLLDYAEIGEGAIVAAGALVLSKTIIPPYTLWAGVPAKFVKNVEPEQTNEINKKIAHNYAMYAGWYKE